MHINWKRYQKVISIAIAGIVIAVSFGIGAWYGYANRPAVEKVLNVINREPRPQFAEVDFDLFWDVWTRLEEKFVDKEKIDREKLVFGAIQGLVRSLEDPYTEFLPPQETKQFKEDIQGSFDGIGAEIGIRKSVLTIIAPLKDSPAEKAGIKAGDKIIKIDDTVTSDLSLNEAVRLIRGPKGTEVRLAIFRDSFDTTKEFKIIRDTIKIPIITTEKKSDGIFVLKLHHFTENAAFEFRKAVQEFYLSGSKKLVLDLRNNPGGFLAVAVDIASWFLPVGEVIARERFADGSEEIYRSQGYRFMETVPVVVVINGGSASASEILAGALRDIRGAKLIGTKTFGKGSVQELENLPRNSSLKITIAKWLTPKGEEINGTGLKPDIEVEIPEGNDAESDVILERAVEVAKNL